MASINEKEIFKVLGYYYDSTYIPVWLFKDGSIVNTNFSNSLLNLIDLSTCLVQKYEIGDRKYTWELLQDYSHEFYFFFNTGNTSKVRESIVIGPVLHDINKEKEEEIEDFSFNGYIWSDFNNKVINLLADTSINSFIMSISFIMRLFGVEPPSSEDILKEYNKNRENKDPAARSYSPVIKNAIDVISENIKDKISLQFVAESINISPKYLSYLFTKETGMNFCEYVQYQRIDIARKQLRESDISYSDLCYNLGFSSQSYFNSVFKKYTGVTPKEYRHCKKTDAEQQSSAL